MSIINMEIFGKRLKELRLEQGKTQDQVAKDLGISSVAYLHYEKNQREPSFEILLKLAKYFNVSLDYLFGLED